MTDHEESRAASRVIEQRTIRLHPNHLRAIVRGVCHQRDDVNVHRAAHGRNITISVVELPDHGASVLVIDASSACFEAENLDEALDMFDRIVDALGDDARAHEDDDDIATVATSHPNVVRRQTSKGGKHERGGRQATSLTNDGACRRASRASTTSDNGLASDTRADASSSAAPLFPRDRSRSRRSHNACSGPRTLFRRTP